MLIVRLISEKNAGSAVGDKTRHTHIVEIIIEIFCAKMLLAKNTWQETYCCDEGIELL